MKQKIILSCVIFLFLLSCQKTPISTFNDGSEKKLSNNALSNELNTERKIVPIPISMDDARSVAIGFAKHRLNSKDSSFNREIENEQKFTENNLDYFYVFNFKDNLGFVIVSAEGYEHPILAYSPEGQFETNNPPVGLINWIGTTKEEIDAIRAGKIDSKRQATAEWSRIVYQFEIRSLKSIIAPAPCVEEWKTIDKGPLMSTEWGQGCGYNDLCPTMTSNSCNHAVTGCVATAMAQIIRYWHVNSNYNWSTMPNNYANAEVARLMHDASISVNMDYGGTASGAWHDDIPTAMKNKFGFSSAQNINYVSGSYNAVQNSLNANQPVILSAYSKKTPHLFGIYSTYDDGHEWVCDGYSESSITFCNEDGTWGGGSTYLYFHMNWGWDGTSNGYYGFSTWAPYNTPYNFQYYQKAIVNLHP